jgi:hypothetical protein
MIFRFSLRFDLRNNFYRAVKAIQLTKEVRVKRPIYFFLETGLTKTFQ